MQSTTNHLNPAAVADLLGISQRTLSRWHALRVGPPRCKVGRTVLYRKDAVDEWLAKHETQPLRSFAEVSQ